MMQTKARKTNTQSRKLMGICASTLCSQIYLFSNIEEDEGEKYTHFQTETGIARFVLIHTNMMTARSGRFEGAKTQMGKATLLSIIMNSEASPGEPWVPEPLISRTM